MGRNSLNLLCGVSLGLGWIACGSSPPRPAPRTPAVEAPPPEPAAPPGPSAYERRWLSACSEGGKIAHCPAPYDQPAVFIDAQTEGDEQPPALCGTAEPAGAGDVRSALASQRRALRACFGKPDGAWVEVGRDGNTTRTSDEGSARLSRAASCLAKLVKPALSNVASAPDRIVLVNGVAKQDAKALSKQHIDDVIASHGSDINTCYDGALEVWPGLRGRIAPSVVIWFDGSVALVRTSESSLDNPALECCINTAVSGWHFGKPAEGAIVIVSLPFRLGPAE